MKRINTNAVKITAPVVNFNVNIDSCLVNLSDMIKGGVFRAYCPTYDQIIAKIERIRVGVKEVVRRGDRFVAGDRIEVSHLD